MPRNNIFQTLKRQYKFPVALIAMWEVAGLNVSRRPMALSETLPAIDEINKVDKTIFFKKVLVFVNASCFKRVNIRRTNILITAK
jgi:hypothetical protein